MLRLTEQEPVAGYTLLEVLVATVLLALVVTLVYSGLGSSSKTLALVDLQLSRDARARTVMTLLGDDLSGVAAGEAAMLVGQRVDLTRGRGDRLLFLTRNRLQLAPDGSREGQTIVSYWVSESDDGESFTLYRGELQLLPGHQWQIEDLETRGVPVTEGLQTMVFSYLDAGGNLLPEWNPLGTAGTGSQNTAAGLPAIVEIEVQFVAAADEQRPAVYRSGFYLADGGVDD